MSAITGHKVPNRWVLRLALLGIPLLVATLLIVRAGDADFATPFAGVNNEVGDVSEAHGYVVAMGPNVRDCKYYLVIVMTDCMEHVVMMATAEKGVVKESLLGRPVIVGAEVTGRKQDPKTKHVTVRLKILSLRPFGESGSG